MTTIYIRRAVSRFNMLQRRRGLSSAGRRGFSAASGRCPVSGAGSGLSAEEARREAFKKIKESEGVTAAKAANAKKTRPVPNGFGLTPVNGHIRYTWRRGDGWDEGQVVTTPFMNMHVHAGCIHYGLSVFEGLKAFEASDGQTYFCNPRANAARMNDGARRLVMPELPEHIFMAGITEAVTINRDFVPPYGSNGAMYLRPFLFASGPMLGLKQAEQFTFIVSCTPVGNYYALPTGDSEGYHALVVDTDRAAPRGTGSVKAAGNYAADMYGLEIAKSMGADTSLYLDSAHNRYVEEFSVANFVGITRDGTYVTPDTPSVLPSITNQMLMDLARDEGMRVERRPIDFDNEIEEFTEVAGCGTAVVLSHVGKISRVVDGETREFKFAPPRVLAKLKERLMRIQVGDEPDYHGWLHRLPPPGQVEESSRILRRALCAVSTDELKASGEDPVANLKNVYDTIAGDYERCVRGRAEAATHCTELLLEHLPATRRWLVLDAGAGTGEAGAMLKRMGTRSVTAFDLSSKMLDRASERKVYDQLVQGCLPDTPFSDARFDAVVCAGCMSPGHASPASYAEFCRVVKPGGLIAFSIPRVYYESEEGQSHRYAIDVLERIGAWERVVEPENRPYYEDIDGLYFLYRRKGESATIAPLSEEDAPRSGVFP